MTVKWGAVAGCLAIAASVAGCSSSGEVVKIGLLTDCQGPFHAYEDAQLSGGELPFLRRGARLAGAGPSGGVTPIEVAGRRVELVRGCQETGEHTQFIEDARRLVETEDVDAVVGGASVVARDLARRYPDVPFVSAFSNEQEVTLRSPARNLFRFSPDYAQDAAGLGAYAYRKLRWRRAAIVAADWSPAWDGAAAFTARSTRPWADAASSNTRHTLAGSVMSPASATAPVRATPSSVSCERATPTTCHPWAVRCSITERPRLRAPNTTAVRLSSVLIERTVSLRHRPERPVRRRRRFVRRGWAVKGR